MRMLRAIPALPVRNMGQSVEYYRGKLGFTLVHKEAGFAILQRDEVEIHLWAATDESWRTRHDSAPVISGAESFIAGTASCRVGIQDVDELYRTLEPLGILHPNGQLGETWYGTREFGVLDPDNNLITFFEPK